ncbi:MAG TPA: alpha/beta fold hydrolase [Methylomirabilota bacterium]|nr:alpha/beta fold hydrolase [Methylomirabilota bacterium]
MLRGFVERPGRGRVSYLSEGSGATTVLLIHGSGMSARSWDMQLQGLPRSLRMIALDLPGHGQSDPAPRAGVEAYAGAVADVLAALECGPVVVVGHSLGGSVAIALAARRPDLVRGLVLIASCVKLPLVDSVGERLVAYLPGPLRRPLFFSMAKKVLFAPQAPADAIAITMRELRACRLETLQADVRAARAMDLTAHAAALDVPTLVLSGGRDRLTTPALAERLSALIPGSRLHIVDGAGHMLPLEAADRVNREIVAFVESLAAPLPATRTLDDRERSLSRLLDRLAGFARRLRGSPPSD